MQISPTTNLVVIAIVASSTIACFSDVRDPLGSQASTDSETGTIDSSDSNDDSNDDSDDEVDSTTETDTGNDTDGDCPVGSNACACGFADQCQPGLVCVDDTCRPQQCGDGRLDPNELCDDGNFADDDGCNADCSPTAVVAVAAGGDHTCALLNSGGVKCWGRGNFGQTGQGNTNIIGDAETPATVPVISLPGKAVAIDSGRDHSCAMLDSGDVSCWGQASSGQLGYADTQNIGDDETPVSSGNVMIGGDVTMLALGHNSTCVVLDSGFPLCWGSGYVLGTGSNPQPIGDNEHPGSFGVLNLGGTVVAIVAASSHACALRDDNQLNQVVCWGANSSGQLGLANTTPKYEASDAVPTFLPSVPVGVGVGNQHTCSLLEDGNVSCWGRSFSGALGYGNIEIVGDNESPGAAVELPGPAIALTVGPEHNCAILDDGAISCWGSGSYGKLGYASTSPIGDDETPATKSPVQLGGPTVAITTGRDHTCALVESGDVFCWGRGEYGALGLGTPADIGDNEPPLSAGPVEVF